MLAHARRCITKPLGRRDNVTSQGITSFPQGQPLRGSQDSALRSVHCLLAATLRGALNKPSVFSTCRQKNVHMWRSAQYAADRLQNRTGVVRSSATFIRADREFCQCLQTLNLCANVEISVRFNRSYLLSACLVLAVPCVCSFGPSPLLWCALIVRCSVAEENTVSPGQVDQLHLVRKFPALHRRSY